MMKTHTLFQLCGFCQEMDKCVNRGFGLIDVEFNCAHFKFESIFHIRLMYKLFV